MNETGVNIDYYADGRATANFGIYGPDTYTFYEREMVLITDLDGVRLFAGVLPSDEITNLPGSDLRRFRTLNATDFTAILDWRIVDYAAEDNLAGDAVRAIMAEYLAEEGITEGYIEDGELLTEIAIGNSSATTAFNKLADARDL
ncbi:MAG: hypothetical protein KBB04_14325 [Methanothrix sp.]|uniref:hypothetical protein n=1 Tax=Methanothrix sp. TaxID=90426 RepID=UPI001B42BC58|nr:hypothetical protein [Methanothrix sp.]MBP7069428.1 hypothetical protein [Methanothrix sp.]